MRTICLILLIILCCNADKHAAELQKALDEVPKSNGEFALPAADQALLDEINTMRNLIARGYLNDPFSNIATFIWEQTTQQIINGAGKLVDAAKELAEQISKVGEKILDWGSELVNSQETLSKIENAAADVVDGVKNTYEKGKNYVQDKFTGIFSGKKRKRRRKRFLEEVVAPFTEFLDTLEKPVNTFGPGKNMNILTWNRRLTQLAMVKKEEIEQHDFSIIVYEGKQYRALKYGTLATYIITNTLGKMIADLFQILRIAYLACKLWFAKVEVPIKNGKTSSTHEMLFADRMEVGCFYTWPDTLCIIGPLVNGTGDLYEKGEPCDGCNYGCSKKLCNPPPSYFYAIREKYTKHVRPQIEKFEIVEGFDGGQPEMGHNFMLDDYSPYSNVLMIGTIMVSLFLLLRNNF